MLCGTPRLLDPVCDSLVRHRANVWWLYDRLAAKSWLRWRRRGVGQLVCDSDQGDDAPPPELALPELSFRGVELTQPVAGWLKRRLQSHGARQARLVEQIDEHFDRLCPTRLILAEDATPLSRAAVASARHHGATSFVVQHGAPVTAFGFAPLEADYLLAWGESSREQLEAWDVPAERIAVTGAAGLALPRRHLTAARPRKSVNGRPPRVLLLATVPPRDQRPDYVHLHLTRRSYEQMLETALDAVARWPGTRLVVKLHPRSPHDPVTRGMLRRYPDVRVGVVTGGSLRRRLRGIDVVLSCMSSAGIEAAALGVPVIQLLPPAAGNVLPCEDWGMASTARSRNQLLHRMADVLENPPVQTEAARLRVFAGTGSGASDIADRIARIVSDGRLPMETQRTALPAASVAGEVAAREKEAA